MLSVLFPFTKRDESKTRSAGTSLGLAVLALGLTACGKTPNVVTDLKVRTYGDDRQNEYVEMAAEINLGQMSFPSISLPIFNPKDPAQQYGSVSLQKTLKGRNVLVVAGNLSAMAKSGLANDKLLPNGHAIPVAGLEHVLAFRAGDRSKIFFGTAADKYMIGAAIAIREFDQITRYVPAIDLFLPLPPQLKVNGLGGVFVGSAPSTSGIGLFVEVDASKLRLAPKATIASAEFAAGPSESDGGGFSFVARQPGGSREAALMRSLYDLQNKKQTLRVR